MVNIPKMYVVREMPMIAPAFRQERIMDISERIQA
jgi:hypothetical protein